VNTQLSSFLSSAPDGGQWTALRAAVLALKKHRIYQLITWLCGPHWRSGRFEEEFLTPAGKGTIVLLLSNREAKHCVRVTSLITLLSIHMKVN